ncbi:MmoB/DmpM family protein, partial [Mycobacterium sp.]|uniref:MmoB/DmpM family protein n=1 Tax=Mycobacterium sp. TaxID=1785 RepID=UPI002BB4770D
MEFGSATAVSNMCGVTLMNTPVGRVVADVMGAKEGVELTEYPSMIRVDGQRVLDFD